MIVGGGVISQYEFSKAWGVSPSAAKGVAIVHHVGGPGALGIDVGNHLIFSFGAVASFDGIADQVIERIGNGRNYEFSLLDNRIRLAWQTVFGAWNIEDDTGTRRLGRSPSPSTGPDSGSNGNDDVDFGSGVGSSGSPAGAGAISASGDFMPIRRRYKHLLPQHWESGIWTWTDEPLTAREILNSAFNGAWGDYGFTRNYHSSLDQIAPLGLDHTAGIKLSNLISEINEKAGLDVVLSGTRTLVWGRKGEGLAPIPDGSSDNRSAGLAITSNDTKIRVVGERIRVQVCNVTLEPDWVSGWEAFIDELAWFREVKEVFELPAVTKADHATIAARAKEVTLAQYAKRKGAPEMLDSRPFGRISRNHLPAWTYIQELVFRSYRIPPEADLYGIPLASLDIADSLLCAVEITGDGDSTVQRYRSTPVEFYPDARAHVIVKGQPLDLIDGRDAQLFYLKSARQLREEWTEAGDFEIDSLNKSIRFRSAMFIDGPSEENKALYSRVNLGEGGGEDLSGLVSADSDYLSIVAPNPDFELSAAEVKASFCFLLGRFYRDFGSGPRRGMLNQSGLELQVLDTTGGASAPGSGTASISSSSLRLPGASGRSFVEVLYEDGGTAAEKAEAAADSALQAAPLQMTGGFRRSGIAGTVLNGTVDRVTVAITDHGLEERVEYAKARASGAALSERTLQRILKTGELFAGEQDLRRTVRQLYLESRWERAAATENRSKSHRKISDIFRQPVGDENVSTKTIVDVNSAAPSRGEASIWKVGDLVWVDAQGHPSSTGENFAGVVVMTPKSNEGTQTKELTVAYSGTVPVRVESGVAGGSMLSANSGDYKASTSGSKSIGILRHAEAVPSPSGGEALALVHLGAGGGGGSAVKVAPLSITDTRPRYIPAPSATLAEGSKRYWLTWGYVDGRVATNWGEHFDVASTPGTALYLFAKIQIHASAANMAMAWEIVSGSTSDAHETPAAAAGARPSQVVVPLGQIMVDGDGVQFALSAGGGSIALAEYLTDVSADTNGTLLYHRSIIYNRLYY